MSRDTRIGIPPAAATRGNDRQRLGQGLGDRGQRFPTSSGAAGREASETKNAFELYFSARVMLAELAADVGFGMRFARIFEYRLGGAVLDHITGASVA